MNKGSLPVEPRCVRIIRKCAAFRNPVRASLLASRGKSRLRWIVVVPSPTSQLAPAPKSRSPPWRAELAVEILSEGNTKAEMVREFREYSRPA